MKIIDITFTDETSYEIKNFGKFEIEKGILFLFKHDSINPVMGINLDHLKVFLITEQND